MKTLGKLSQVKLREFWSKEAQEFTPWLAKEENLNLLGEAIGMDLELKQTEYPVGDCKVDIFAQDVNYDEEHLVVIESQLEKTDHKHLGQLLTYASGLNAKAVVWIAKKITEDHKKALDWLNENSKDIAFFGLEVELWKIGESMPALKFNVVCQPNNWFKSIQPKNTLTDTKLLQQKFWTEFVDYMEDNKTHLRLSTPRPQHWYDFSIGRSGFITRLTVDSQKNRLGCKLRIVKTEHGFNALQKDKDLIEQELKAKLEWKELPDKKSSNIAQYKDGDFQNQEEWPQLFSWFKERAEAFYKTFYSRIQEMNLSEEAA